MSCSASASKTFAKSRSWWLALMAIGGGLYFLIAILALHVLPTGLNPTTKLISDYANSSFGFLQATVFLVWSIGWLALATDCGLDLYRHNFMTDDLQALMA